MHQDAVNDGIRFVSNSHIGGPTMYYPNCYECGEEMMVYNYKSGRKYTCKKCRLQKYLSDKENREIVSYEAKENKLAKAIKRISKMVRDINQYDDALVVVKKHLHKDGWFDSTEEIMVALELLKNKVKTRHQVRFGRYRADFVLPEHKVVLEVDGTIYHTVNTLEKEIIRDQLITLYLGAEWEVIRITDELINENITRLMPAIKQVCKRRQKERQKNDGALPQRYSRRNV